jgi:hypothetical protein
VVAERLAHVGKQVDMAWTKNEAPAELERIPPKAVLAVASAPGPLPGGSVVCAKEVQEASTP